MQNSGLTLNLGSGRDRRDECVNADILERAKPDWLVDISKPLAATTIDWCGEPLEIGPGTFSKIIAIDVLEHIPDLVTAMTNCRDLLEMGGEMHISVPYDLSLGAWQDPTHVRAFNERSWVYYCAWAWYLGWTGSRFNMERLEYTLSPGTDLELPQEQLLRTPRAVESMYVVLKKVKI
jgi:SAM-dependent methyltransferase